MVAIQTPVAVALSCLLSSVSAAGTFNLLSYNVAGLPAWLSDNGIPGDKAVNAARVGALLGEKAHDFVHLQEDFAYNDEIYGADIVHPHRTDTKGNVPFGDGLNTLSNYPWTAGLTRQKWDECWIIEADCLTPKGFSFMRAALDGAEVDLYNLHADAGDTAGDQNARSAGIDQLLNFIGENSAGRAIILAGDFNDRWTSTSRSINKLIDAGFIDAWVDLIKGGQYPEAGSPANGCGVPATNNDCEIVDKVFYRSGDSVALDATSFSYVSNEFLQPDGNKLSDHNPVLVDFAWS